MEKLELKEKITAVDQNIRELWDALDEPNQKALKSELFILNRFISNVKTNNREVQEHHVLLVNELYNKNFFDLQKHPKLLWLLLCMCSYNNETVFYHEWIALGKSSPSDPKIKVLSQRYPDLNSTELELLSANTTTAEILQIAEDYDIETTIKKPKTKAKSKKK
jgi:hypothetical protein